MKDRLLGFFDALRQAGLTPSIESMPGEKPSIVNGIKCSWGPNETSFWRFSTSTDSNNPEARRSSASAGERPG